MRYAPASQKRKTFVIRVVLSCLSCDNCPYQGSASSTSASVACVETLITRCQLEAQMGIHHSVL